MSFTILNDRLQVIEKLEVAMENEKQLTSSKPSHKEISEWLDVVKNAEATVIKLSTTAYSLPGGCPGTVSDFIPLLCDR